MDELRIAALSPETAVRYIRLSMNRVRSYILGSSHRMSCMLTLAALTLCAACSSEGGGSPTPTAPNTHDSGAPGVDGGTATPDASVPDTGAISSSSHGSGGVTCASAGSLGAGRQYCLGTLGGSEFKLAEPVGGSGPLKIVAYLHGDGAGAYKSDSAMKALLPFADKHHAIVLSVLSPNKCAWWQAASQTDCSGSASPVPDVDGANADAFRTVLESVRKGFDVTNDRAYFYGSSGGSIFLTTAFLRRFGDRFPAVYALNCGGEIPGKKFDWDTSNAASRNTTSLYFTYGDQDFLKDAIEKAIPFFSGLGFPTDTKVVPGATHCAFDAHARAVEVFESTVTP